MASTNKLRKKELQHYLRKHPPELFQPSESTIQKNPLVYYLNLPTFHEVSLTYFSWKCWNFSEESNLLSFCGLFEIHYPLSSPVIAFSPSSSLPFHSTPVSCQIWMILKGNISHQGLIIITKIDPTWCLQRWRVRLQLSCTPQGRCGNTVPFALHSPSLKWAQPARPKNFYSPDFNWASSYAFSILSIVFQKQQRFEKLWKKTHFIWSCAYRMHAPIYLWALAYSS